MHHKGSLTTPRTFALVVHYFLGYMLVYPFLATLLTLKLNPQATYLLPSTQWFVYLLTFMVTTLLALPLLRKEFLSFRQHWKTHLKRITIFICILVIVNLACSLLISLLTNTSDSVNQGEVISSLHTLPFTTFLFSGIILPIVEECVFRAGVFKYLRVRLNFLISALISSVLFGSIHIMSSLVSGDFIDVTYLFVYASIGFILALAYEKSDTIWVPISIHCLNNLLAFLTIL
ncbi:MAG: type II CAAX endopeptidase family protein [Longicatena sp.]